MNENFNKARLISVVFIVAFLLPIFPATIGALKAASESSPEIFHEFSMFLFGGMIIFIHFPILNVIFAGINRFWLFLGSYVLLVAYGHIYQYMMLIVSGKHYESFSELFAGKSYSFFGTVGDFTIALIPYLKYYVALIIVIHIYLFKKRGGDFRDIEMISALCDIDYPWHRRYELIQSIARDYPNIRDRRYLLEILINYWKIGKPNRVFDITLYVSSRETRESLGLDTAQELSRVPSQDSRIEQESINNMMAEAERVRGEYSIHTSIRDRQRAQQAGNIYGGSVMGGMAGGTMGGSLAGGMLDAQAEAMRASGLRAPVVDLDSRENPMDLDSEREIYSEINNSEDNHNEAEEPVSNIRKIVLD